MQQVMQSTKLEKQICAKVWQLSNPNLQTIFTKEMFTIAMHLMFRKRQDPNIEIPQTLPVELAVSAKEETGEANQLSARA